LAWAARLAAQPRERTARCSKKEVKNAERDASRRRPLAGAISVEQQEVSDTEAVAAQARYGAAQASLEQARVNLERTQIRAPANGWVTNLLESRTRSPTGRGSRR
jgi:multidrug resistance efflux pump